MGKNHFRQISNSHIYTVPLCPALDEQWREERKTQVRAADNTSNCWEGNWLSEETRAGLDPKHIWETPRNNCATPRGGEGSSGILLVRDNESVKFGVFEFMWLLGTHKETFGIIKYEMHVILFITRVVIINWIFMTVNHLLIKNSEFKQIQSIRSQQCNIHSTWDFMFPAIRIL